MSPEKSPSPPPPEDPQESQLTLGTPQQNIMTIYMEKVDSLTNEISQLKEIVKQQRIDYTSELKKLKVTQRKKLNNMELKMQKQAQTQNKQLQIHKNYTKQQFETYTNLTLQPKTNIVHENIMEGVMQNVERAEVMLAQNLSIEEKWERRQATSKGTPQKQVVQAYAHALGNLAGQTQAVRHEAHIVEGSQVVSKPQKADLPKQKQHSHSPPWQHSNNKQTN